MRKDEMPDDGETYYCEVDGTIYQEGEEEMIEEYREVVVRTEREKGKIEVDSFEIKDENCVNSKWIARFLAREDQECCQCSVGDCKVKVAVSMNGHKPYTYVLTEREFKALTTNKTK